MNNLNTQTQTQTKTNLEGNNIMNEVKETPVNINRALAKERFKEVVLSFKDYFNSDQVKNLNFKHFILYSMIRGQDLSKVTHSVDSESFKSALTEVHGLASFGKKNSLSSFLVEPFGLSLEELKSVVREYDKELDEAS